jgi:hypothetical protein
MADDVISIGSIARYTAKLEAPDFPFGALGQDENRELTLSTVFDLRDGLISGIRITPAAA